MLNMELPSRGRSGRPQRRFVDVYDRVQTEAADLCWTPRDEKKL